LGWNITLRSWENTAGGPWEDGSDEKKRVERTIVANRFTQKPLEWRQRLPRLKGRTPPGTTRDGDYDYQACLERACEGRRFFVTKQGRFGTGPLTVKKSDLICVLLGGKVPFVLRACADSDVQSSSETLPSTKNQKYHWFIGEAYCDWLIQYGGDIHTDIETGNLPLQWFQLK
jgi:hypothetical protein